MAVVDRESVSLIGVPPVTQGLDPPDLALSPRATPSHAGPRQLRRLLDAVMSVASDLDLPTVLQRIVEAARDLAGARYGALGVLDSSRTYLS
jgi:hypothetical protein